MTLLARPVVVLDVAYENDSARVGVVVADRFDAAVGRDLVVDVFGVAAYEPGAFYKRELPCLLAALQKITLDDDAVLVVDGYVVLDDAGAPGLGLRLHEATGRAVVGVAKSAFRGSGFARAVVRGVARRPLYVTAAGVDVDEAAAAVAGMAGAHRLPALLLRADQLARGRLAPSLSAD